jgi:hypothetical protein
VKIMMSKTDKNISSAMQKIGNEISFVMTLYFFSGRKNDPIIPNPICAGAVENWAM